MSKEIYSASIFMDSGAYSLYNAHVRGFGEQIGKHGRPLDRSRVKRSQGDYSWYDLSPGSECRAYLDRYASFIKRVEGTGVLIANVDAIANPEKSWEIQQYFEKEHGVRPIPVIHYGASLHWVDRYLEAGHKFLGLGGLGQSVKPVHYVRWGDRVFLHLCPKSNNYLPLVQTHGFAMTSWKLICRWPWWSVDSATWVKLAAYGWLMLPKWTKGVGFRYDVPPIQINVSRKPTDRKTKFWWREGIKSPRQTRDRHYDNTSPYVREATDRWLEYLKLPMGAYSADGEVAEMGVTTHFNLRSIANLTYLKGLEESRPEWPHPLDPALVCHKRSDYQKGFAL